MKPDFALSLSFEGIRLLHRSPEGWTALGDVPLDSRDLSGDLAALRRKGLALGTPWRGTKLLLPPEQVRILTLDGAVDEAEVRAALEGATPYPVADLVIDPVQAGGRTHVAAVARETLEEAEAFAAEHGFQPVCFAALPVDSGFPGEAFFGPTRLAPSILGGEAVTREEPPEPAPVEAEIVATPAEPVAADPAPVEPPAPVAEPDDNTPQIARPPRAASKTAAPPASDAPAEEPTPVAEVAPPPGPSAPLSATGVPEPVFASRARPLRGQTRDAAAPAPVAPPVTPREGTRAEPVLGQPPRDEAPAAGWALSAPPPSARKDPRVPPQPSALPARKEPAVTAAAAPRPKVEIAPRPPADPAPRPAAPQPTSEAARLTIFGARKRDESPRVGGKPRYLGLALTAILVVIMLAVALFASASEQGLAGLLRLGAEPETQVAEAPKAAEPEQVANAAAPPEASEAAAEAVAAAISALPTASPEAEEAAEASAAPVTPEEAERVYASTGVWLRAATLPPLDGAATAPILASTDDAAPQAPLPTLAALTPDAPLAAAANPPPPGAMDAAPVLATPEGVVTSEGVLVVAGSPDLVPPTRPAPEEAPSGWLNAMAEPPARTPPLRPDAPEELLAALAAQAVPDALAFAPTELPSDLPPQIAPGGVSLAGLRPEPRPDDLAPEEPEPEVLAAFDGPRPGPRPEGLAPEPPEAPDVTDALAEALAAPEVPQEPDIESTLAAIAAASPDPLAGATPRAVAATRRPDTRPNNFGRVVATQLDRLARSSQPRTAAVAPSAAPSPSGGSLQPNEAAESEPEVASSAAAAPSGPTASSVAQAATLADAMSLRETNLIGVYGQPGARRALVRLGNGRYLRVGVGDSLDGGQVTAIGDNALNYVKRGRTEVLVIPGG